MSRGHAGPDNNRMRIIMNPSPPLAVSRITKIKYFQPSPPHRKKGEREFDRLRIYYRFYYRRIRFKKIREKANVTFVCKREKKRKKEKRVGRQQLGFCWKENKTMELEFDRDWNRRIRLLVRFSDAETWKLWCSRGDREKESQLCLKSSRGKGKLDGAARQRQRCR